MDNSSCVVTGTDLLTLNYSSSFSFSQFNVKPEAISRLLTIRGCFEHYRFTKLRFTVLPACTGCVAIGYIAGRNLTTPSGYSNGIVSQLACSALWYPGETVPITIEPRGSALASPQLKWLGTNHVDGDFGTFFVGGPTSTAVTAIVRLDYTCVFKNPIANGFQVDAEEKKSEGDVREIPIDDPVKVNWYVPQQGMTLDRPALSRQTADMVAVPAVPPLMRSQKEAESMVSPRGRGFQPL